MKEERVKFDDRRRLKEDGAKAPVRASAITKRFGASVKRLRHSLGLSQEALAERAGLHRTYIADVEGRGRNVTLKTMERLAAALEVSTAALLTQTGEPSNDNTDHHVSGRGAP